MSEVGGDELLEFGDKDVSVLRREIKAEKLDGNKPTRFRLISPKYRTERSGTDLMQHTKRPEGVGWRRTSSVRIQCGYSSAEGIALLHLKHFRFNHLHVLE